MSSNKPVPLVDHTAELAEPAIDPCVIKASSEQITVSAPAFTSTVSNKVITMFSLTLKHGPAPSGSGTCAVTVAWLAIFSIFVGVYSGFKSFTFGVKEPPPVLVQDTPVAEPADEPVDEPEA